jgi:ankyrin repeat protein
MDNATLSGNANGTPQPLTVSQLPPEALALATRLFSAARSGSLPIFESALPSGRIANLTNDKGDTLIMLAAYHGHAPLVRLLLQHGADPNRVNDRGQSPLAGVVFKNERECVEALLEGGADPEVGNPNAIECCQVFKMEEFEGLFRGQVERLKGQRQGEENGEGGEGSA